MVVSCGRQTADKVICPRCGAKMNHHCDKLVYGGRPLPHDASEIDTTEIDSLSPADSSPSFTLARTVAPPPPATPEAPNSREEVSR